MRWDTIYFDLDDTLISYEQTFKKASIYTFLTLKEHWGISEEINEIMWFHIFKKNCDHLWQNYEQGEWTKRQYRFRRLYDTMIEFRIKVNERMVQDFQHYFDKVVSHFAIPMPGIEQLLLDLEKENIKLGIITNGKKNIQIEKINTLGFQHFFSKEAIVISEDVQVEKPNPKIFEIALDKLESYTFPPLYIGDSWSLDMIGANQAHWDTIYFNTRGQPLDSSIPVIDICQNVAELHRSIFSYDNIQKVKQKRE